MKQWITEDQLEELSTEQVLALENWWYEVKEGHLKDNLKHGIVYRVDKYLGGGRNFDPAGTRIELPLLTVGYLIELLGHIKPRPRDDRRFDPGLLYLHCQAWLCWTRTAPGNTATSSGRPS